MSVTYSIARSKDWSHIFIDLEPEFSSCLFFRVFNEPLLFHSPFSSLFSYIQVRPLFPPSHLDPVFCLSDSLLFFIASFLHHQSRAKQKPSSIDNASPNCYTVSIIMQRSRGHRDRNWRAEHGRGASFYTLSWNNDEIKGHLKLSLFLAPHSSFKISLFFPLTHLYRNIEKRIAWHTFIYLYFPRFIFSLSIYFSSSCW